MAQSETQWWDLFPATVPVSHHRTRSGVEACRADTGIRPAAKFSYSPMSGARTGEGGTIESSINLPAQTMYQTREIVYQLCKQAGIKRIIFYCGRSGALHCSIDLC
jgi:arsenical-resistance protein 2